MKRTNAPKKKKVAKQAKGLRRSPNTKPRRRLQNKSAITHPYLACISGPASMSPMGIGFPDGNPNKSLVVDYKQVLTLTPDNGYIRFALVSSPYGCVALGRAGAGIDLTAPAYTASGLSYTWTPHTSPAINAAGFLTVPFQENAGTSVDGEAMGPYAIGQYRGLVIAADVSFTGSTMANGGVVKVYKATPTVTDVTPTTFLTAAVNNKDVTDLSTGAYIGSIAGRYTGPARVPLNIRSASAKPEYRTTWERTVSSEVQPYALSTTGTLLTPSPFVGFDNSVPVTIVEYSGLDSTASITVEVRSCVEVVPRVGTLAAFAKPSPPASLPVWEKVANYVRSLPAASVARTLASGITGYAAAGVPGSLVAMAGTI